MTGSFYLLVSIGFQIICGVMRIWHIGYSYMFILTAYLTWFFMRDLGLGLIPSIAATVTVQIAFAILIYKVIMFKYIVEEEESLLLASLLLISLIIREAVNFFYPPYVGVNLPEISKEVIYVIGSAFSVQMLIVALTSLALLGLFLLFFLKTRIGLQIRATTMDLHTAELLGINREKVYLLVSILSLIPPMVAMYLTAPIWGVHPDIGSEYFHNALLVSVLGGMGNLMGSLVAAYVLGLINSFVHIFLGEPRLGLLISFIFILIVLIIKKEGLTKGERLW
ncbi:MAG: branched-chain amino acid ABC transporter permease [Candidatus Bathyarchaeia archaeon]